MVEYLTTKDCISAWVSAYQARETSRRNDDYKFVFTDLASERHAYSIVCLMRAYEASIGMIDFEVTHVYSPAERSVTIWCRSRSGASLG